MRKRIIRSFLSMFVISMSIAFILLYMMVFNMYLQDEIEQMENTIDLIELSNLDSEKLQDYLNETNSRLTIIEADTGDVVYDNLAVTDEDHLSRDEVQKALKEGSGDAIRYSQSLQQEYLYTAKYDEEENKVYRLSMPFDGFSQSVSVLFPYFFAAFAIGILIAWFLSERMASTILNPISQISREIEKSAQSGKPAKFQEYKYPELQEITGTITRLQKQTEEHLSALQNEKRIRQEFFANASHELKTPLTSIQGYSDLLLNTDQDLTKFEQTCLDQISSQSRRMDKLIADILMISKIESSQERILTSHVNVQDLLEQVLVQTEPVNTLHCSIQIFCAPLTAYICEEYLAAIFSNLITNAYKYNKPEGSVEIIVKEEDKKLLIQVKDTGIGMSEEEQKHVFERFYRADAQRSSTVPGTGLGLSIVRRVANFYHGEVKVESVQGVYTCVSVLLPVILEPNSSNSAS